MYYLPKRRKTEEKQFIKRKERSPTIFVENDKHNRQQKGRSPDIFVEMINIKTKGA